MNKSWNCAGIYADEGKAATGTKFRDSFNDMIEDCYAGKIDMILLFKSGLTMEKTLS